MKQLARRASAGPSRIRSAFRLITTREPLADLAAFQRREDSPWGSVLRVDLTNLTDVAGAALLHHAGATRAGTIDIKPDDKELLAASREVDGHALTLNLLGRFLSPDAHSGDVHRRDLVKFEQADRNEQGAAAFRMLASFENWFSKSSDFGTRQLAVLRLLGLFDRPADAGCISALRQDPAIPGLTDPLFSIRPDASTIRPTIQPILAEDWNTATSFLTDFGLIAIHSDPNNREPLLHCHPLIREYFGTRLASTSQDAWLTGNRRVCDSITKSVEIWPTGLADIETLAQAAIPIHGCRIGLQQAVLDDLYYSRMRRGSALRQRVPNHAFLLAWAVAAKAALLFPSSKRRLRSGSRSKLAAGIIAHSRRQDTVSCESAIFVPRTSGNVVS